MALIPNPTLSPKPPIAFSRLLPCQYPNKATIVQPSFHCPYYARNENLVIGCFSLLTSSLTHCRCYLLRFANTIVYSKQQGT